MWVIIVIIVIILIWIGYTQEQNQKTEVKKEPILPREQERISPKKQEPVLSPLEKELNGIKPGNYLSAKRIAKYVIPYYFSEPYAEMGGVTSSASIQGIVSEYVNNQLAFSEKYKNHVIDLSGGVETIGKEGEIVYLSIGDGHYYKRSGTSGESVKQLIKCQLDELEFEDDNYKDLVLNMKPGAKVTLVGILGKEEYGPFKLYETKIIEVNGVVPESIMEIAVETIYEKYETEDT